MSLGTPAHALNLQTNVNGSRYFFATQEAGEQELYLSTVMTGAISTQVLGISGPAGNEVPYTIAPNFIATEFLASDQGLAVGGASTYWTASSITSSITGISMSTDRLGGTGIACIESYRGNGNTGGFEFLSRGLDSGLLSTTNAGINNYMSSLGRPGATAVFGATGTILTAGVQASQVNSIDVPAGPGGRACFNINDLSGAGGLTVESRWSMGTSGIPTGSNAGSDLTFYTYADGGAFLGSPFSIKRSDGAATFQNLSSVNGVAYPQNLLSTVMSGVQGAAATSNTVTLLFSHADANTSNMIPGQNYLVDVPASIATGAPGGAGAWLEMGVRLGGNGSFNYSHSVFIPPGGTPAQGVSYGLVQVADMGSTNKNIDIVGYLQGVASLSISTSQAIGGVPAYMKMVT
jgi:hypothetical protein